MLGIITQKTLKTFLDIVIRQTKVQTMELHGKKDTAAVVAVALLIILLEGKEG